MERFLSVLVLGLVLASLPAPAAATPSTATPECEVMVMGECVDRADSASSGAASGSTYVGQVDNHTRIIAYRYSDKNQTFAVVIEADRPTLLAISDALGPVSDEGVSEIPSKDVSVDSGRSTITMQVQPHRGSAAISVASPDGAVYISTGVPPVNPLGDSNPTLGWLGGAGIAVGMFLLAGLWVLRQEGGGVEVAGP
jgi:hypothetical protein